MQKYFYLFGSIIFFCLFLDAFFRRKDLRKRMLIVGLIVGIVGIISEKYFFADYWRPPLIYRFGPFGGPEDFLFGMVAGGWGGVAYEVYLKRRLRKGRPHHYWIVPLMFICEGAFIYFRHSLNLNSIYASALGLITPALVIIILRRDLIYPCLYSGLLFGITLMGFEAIMLIIDPQFISNYFLLYKKVIMIGPAPITELIWGISCGALFGVFYEFMSGKSLYKSRSQIINHTSKRPPSRHIQKRPQLATK